MEAMLAAAVGGAVSSVVAGVLAYRQGRAKASREMFDHFETRLRRVELRTASLRAGLRVERRKSERKGSRAETD